MADLNSAVNLRPEEPAFWFLRGVARLSAKDYRGTAEDFLEAIQADESLNSVYYADSCYLPLALAYLFAGDFDSARNAMERVDSNGVFWTHGRVWRVPEVAKYIAERSVPPEG